MGTLSHFQRKKGEYSYLTGLAMPTTELCPSTINRLYGEFGRKQVVLLLLMALMMQRYSPRDSQRHKPVQPTLPIDAANAAPTSNVTKPAEQDQEGEAQEAQEDEELDPQTVTEREDKESDRTTDAPLVGRQLRGLYENGWFVGEIQYFNRSLEEYCVTFQDGSSDYVTNDDIDGTDLILL